MSLIERIGDFVKTNISATTKVYRGNNLTIWVKDNDIQIVDADAKKTDNTLYITERWDYSNLTPAEQETTTTPIELVEKWITDDKFVPQTTPVEGGGSGSGDVTVVDNDTDFSTETTLAAVLAKITSDPSTATNQDIANAILSAWATQGVPLRSQQGIAFGVSSKQNNVLSGISTGDDECAYLFRSIVGSGGVALRSFFLSFESTTNDEYEIRFSVNPTFSNHTFVDGNFSQDPIIGPTNPVQSKLEVAVAGQLGVPSGPLIDGYDEAIGGRFLLGKRAMGNQTVDSRLLFELPIPEGAMFAISILASTNGAAVKASANWNE